MKRNILLNPGPATTTNKVKQSMVVPDICPREEEFGQLLINCQHKLLGIAYAPQGYECILLPGSGTAAIESALLSSVGDKQTILIIDNGAYGLRMSEIAETYQLKFEVLKYNWGSPVNLTEIENILAQGNIDTLAFVHHETTVGILNPLTELYQLANKYSCKTVVDAMSSFAGLPISLSETPVDFLVSSSNKCLQGMAGLGIVFAKSEALVQAASYRKRNYYTHLPSHFQSEKKGGQFLFTPPVQILYALNTSIDELLTETLDGRIQRYDRLYRHLISGMVMLGFKTLVPEHQHAKLLTAFIEPTHTRYQFKRMHDYLYERGITIYPGKGASKDTFRIANIGDLQISDLDLFLKILADYLQTEKINPLYL